MTGYVVVDLDDDTLRDRLVRELTEHQAVYRDGYLTGEPPYFYCGFYNDESPCGWRSDDERDDHMEQHLAHVADVLRAVLRGAGTPATTETVAQSMAETAARVSVGSAVTYAEVLDALMAAAGYVPRVTDWTEAQP